MNITPINQNNQAFGMKFSPKAKETLVKLAEEGSIELKGTKLLKELGANSDNATVEDFEVWEISRHGRFGLTDIFYHPEVTISQSGNAEKIRGQNTGDNRSLNDTIYDLLTKLHTRYIGTKENIISNINSLPE